MGFVQFLITKLVGYDILKSEKELKSSLANVKRELSSVTQHKNALMSDVERKQEEIVTAKKDVANIIIVKDVKTICVLIAKK